jgi:hypothetical protein
MMMRNRTQRGQTPPPPFRKSSCLWWFQAGLSDTISAGKVQTSASLTGSRVLTWVTRPTVGTDAGYVGRNVWDLGTNCYGYIDEMTVAQPITVLFCGQQRAAIANKIVFGVSDTGPVILNTTAADRIQVYSGANLWYYGYTGYNGDAKRVEGCTVNGSASSYWLNSTTPAITGNSGTTGLAAQRMYLGASQAGLYLMGGKCAVFAGFSGSDTYTVGSAIRYIAQSFGVALT